MPKVHIEENGNACIWCPGCKQVHVINTAADGRPKWTFNGDVDKPTFAPSLKVMSGHHVPGQPQPPNCWNCNDAKESGYKSPCGLCHSFIRGGMIQFLGDCTHELKGQTVPLEEFRWDG